MRSVPVRSGQIAVHSDRRIQTALGAGRRFDAGAVRSGRERIERNARTAGEIDRRTESFNRKYGLRFWRENSSPL